MSVTMPVVDETTTAHTVELAVGGMSCAACAARVERSLNKLDGVRASVNYATERASVAVSEAVPVADLIAQVERTGYRAAAIDSRSGARTEDDRVRYLWRRLVVALLFGAPLGDLSLATALSPSIRFPGWQWVLLALTAPIALWCAWPFHRNAVVAARHRTTSMDTLVSLGITAASGWSIYTAFAHAEVHRSVDGRWGLLFSPAGSVYLDVVAAVTVFVLAGRLLEARAKRNAGSALTALGAVAAKDAVLVDEAGVERQISADLVRPGDRFVVRSGQTIPCDGVILDGQAAVDASLMTGESTPVELAVGDALIGGTVVAAGYLVARAVRTGADTQLAQLTRLVEHAQTEKAGIQRLADRICVYFVPCVLICSALTLLGWLLAGGSLEHSFSAALAVLIIACPCALGLATPMALLVASGRGAELGVFIKGHQALESARAVDTVVLDKTGTVTVGRLGVTELRPAAGVDRADVLRWAAAVEHRSEHPVAIAIGNLAVAEVAVVPEARDFTAIAGSGALGVVDGHRIMIGSPRLFREQALPVPADLNRFVVSEQSAGRTVVLVGRDEQTVGAIAFGDEVKPSAAAAVAELSGLGLRTVLLTGDNRATAEAVGAAVGVDEVIAEVLPVDKAATIAALQRQGRVVAMVGDGVNDAPALAGADLGMAVVSGTDVALAAAELILVRDDLRVVPCSLRLARATVGTIRGNLTWAFGYNLAALPLAACGLLNPLIAGAAMALSSLFVVTNSLRLRRFDRPSRSPQSAVTPVSEAI